MSLRREQWHDWLHPYNPCSLEMFIIVFEENKNKKSHSVQNMETGQKALTFMSTKVGKSVFR